MKRTKQNQEAIKIAAQMAAEIHRGQIDKGENDYFAGHLTSVASMGKTWKEQVLGYLHDAAEDTPITEMEVMNQLQEKLAEKLTAVEFDELLTALQLLNNKHSETREEYLSKVVTNSLAARVKLNDLTNNMDLTRLSNPTEKDLERVERYKKEIEMVKKSLSSLENK
ncbi:MAG TPA: phosphohydrolase [Bacteroidales bacterium]|nr:phosphohydrolase [Bacteroidales bacterium]